MNVLLFEPPPPNTSFIKKGVDKGIAQDAFLGGQQARPHTAFRRRLTTLELPPSFHMRFSDRSGY